MPADSQKRKGPRIQSRDMTCRRTIARNSGEPLSGAEVTAGMGSPVSKRSRTNQLIPPHSPASALPTPTQRGSMKPRRTVGPGGKRFEKCRPWTDGRKPGTAFELGHVVAHRTP